MESKRMHRGALRTEQEIQELEALRAAAIEEFEAHMVAAIDLKAGDVISIPKGRLPGTSQSTHGWVKVDQVEVDSGIVILSTNQHDWNKVGDRPFRLDADTMVEVGNR